MQDKLLHIKSLTLLESEKSGNVWKVMILEEGLSKNGKFYPAQVLQKARHLFEKAKVCFYEWKGKHFDHLPPAIEKIRPEGFPLQIAGYLDNIKFESMDVEGESKRGLTGYLHFLNHASVNSLKDMLKSAWEKGLKKIIGLSINALGPHGTQMVSGRPLDVVQGLEHVLSVDLVSHPAAGGQFAKLLAGLQESERREVDMFKDIIGLLQKMRPALLEGVDIENITEDKLCEILEALLQEQDGDKQKKEEARIKAEKDKKEKEEAAKKAEAKDLEEAVKAAETAMAELDAKQKDLIEAQKNAANVQSVISLVKAGKLPLALALLQKTLKTKEADEELDEFGNPIKKDKKKKKGEEDTESKESELEKKVEALLKQNKIKECKDLLKELLASSGLPEVVQSKISKRFSGTVFQESDVKEEIKSEKETLAKLSESGEIMDLGDGEGIEFSRQRTGKDRLQSSMDLMFGYEPDDNEKAEFEGIDAFKGIREAYVKITGDTEITGVIPRNKLRRLQEAETGDFTYMLGYTINRRMMKEYKGLPELWRNIANVIPVKDFKMQELIRWGGFGVLPEVIAARTTQGTETDTATPTYPELGFPADSERIYGVGTYGGMVTITRRAIINDDLRQLSKLPVKIARAGNRTLNQFVFDLMMNCSAAVVNAGTSWPTATASTGQALYVAKHNNYTTTALGFDALNDLLAQGYNQGERGYATTLGATMTDSTTTCTLTDATAGTYFKAGDIIEVDGEYMQVRSISSADLTVTRGILGTTAAAHSNGSEKAYKITSILGLSDATLWVPRKLKGQAEQLINSTLHPESGENAVNTLKGAAKIMVSPYLRGDENNYFISYGKQEIDLIEIGFLNGKQAPEILVQDAPTVGNVFTKDTIRYKVRHEYGGVVPDFRAFAAGIVSGTGA